MSRRHEWVQVAGAAPHPAHQQCPGQHLPGHPAPLLPLMFLFFAQANSGIYLSFLYFLVDLSMKYCEVDPVLCYKPFVMRLERDTVFDCSGC